MTQLQDPWLYRQRPVRDLDKSWAPKCPDKGRGLGPTIGVYLVCNNLPVVSSILGSLSILLITFLGSIMGNSHLPFQYLSCKYPRKLAPKTDIILLCIANVIAMIFHNHIFRDTTNSLISARTLHPIFWQDLLARPHILGTATSRSQQMIYRFSEHYAMSPKNSRLLQNCSVGE